MAGFFQDLKVAARSLARHPRHLLVSAVTLALGIGANVAIFSVFESVVLRPLPYPRPDEIVSIRADRPFTLEEQDMFRERSGALRAVSGYESRELTLLGQGEPQLVPVGMVAPAYAATFGHTPALGRWLAAEDARPGAEAVVVLSDALWRRCFSADSAILGRQIRLRGGGQETRTVIGVMPSGHRPLDPAWQAWVPQVVDRASRGYVSTARVMLVGRLASGATVRGADIEMHAIIARMMHDDPERKLENVRVQTLHETRVGNLGRSLAIMLGSLGVVLLIACFNVASVALARADQRVYEVALRMSLGSPRHRLFRQLLMESMLVALAAGTAGVAAASLTLHALTPMLPSAITQASDVRIDGAVLGFALLVSLTAGVVFGVAPAFRLSRTDLAAGLRTSDPLAGDNGSRWLRSALVASEIALSMALATGGGAMLKSLWLLNRQPAGFAADRLLTFRPLPSSARYRSDAQRLAFQSDLQARIAARSDVQSVAAGFPLPMTGEQMAMAYEVSGEPASSARDAHYAAFVVVTPGYFSTLGIRVLEGRVFTAEDRAGSEPVALVSRRMATVIGGGRPAPAMGREIQVGGGAPVRIIGIVDDVKGQGLADDVVSTLYRPYAQESWVQALYLAVRTVGRPENVVSDLRKIVWSVDPQVPIASMRTMVDRVAETQADPRFFTLLLLLASAVAISLAGVGAYGVMSVVVSSRRREYGIRLALGAAPRDILRRALATGSVPVVIGLVAGLAGAWAFTHWLRSLLYGVQQFDPAVLVIAAVVLALSACLALYLPARRAAASDPCAVLRTE